MCERLRYVTITHAELAPGTLVMVPQAGAAVVHEGPCIIALAKVLGPDREEGFHWLEMLELELYGMRNLPQRYHQDEILGVPTLGMTRAWEAVRKASQEDLQARLSQPSQPPTSPVAQPEPET